jgi:hypothetical protein
VKARRHHIGQDGQNIISDYKAEEPGKFFAPFGLLIPAGGRLLLAIGERLATDRKLVSVFDDTDSMAFADYHKNYSRSEFREKVKEITDWFQPLNPYKHDVPLFGFEDVNFVEWVDPATRKKTREWKPLFCVAVSAKRYALFNRDRNGNPIIRKASAHGLGDVELPTGYKARYDHVAAPIVKSESGEAPWVGRIFNSPKSGRVEIDPNDWVSATKPQLKAIGAKPGSRRYVHKGQRRFSKSSVSLSVRQYQQAQHRITIEERAKRRRKKPKIAGSAAALFLDMWTEAILELDRKGSLDGIDESFAIGRN